MLDRRVDIYFCYILMGKILNGKARIPTRPTNYRKLFSFYNPYINNKRTYANFKDQL